MIRLFPLLAIPSAAAAFAACAPGAPGAGATEKPTPGDPPVSADSDASADTGGLAAARRRWEARRPAAYAYTLTIACFCVQRGDYAVEVRGGRVASVRTEAGESVPEDRSAYVVTVERIAEAAGRGTPTRVVYDPALGYPAEAEIGTLANDAGTAYRVRALRPL